MSIMLKRVLAAFFLLALLGIGSQAGRSASAEPPGKTILSKSSGRIIVKFKQPLGFDIDNLALSSQGLSIESSISQLGTHVVQVTPGSEDIRIEELKKNPLVEYAEPDYPMGLLINPNDPSFDLQWNLSKIQAPQAWDITTGLTASVPVTIAVIDTGVLLTHPDLTGKLVPGATFIAETTTPNDDHGHGTHVAGIAAASSNNSTGISGLSWGAKIMPVKVLDSSGSGPSSGVANGVIYAADHGARVINLSLGGIYYSQTMINAVNYALSKNVLIIAAMGNAGNPEVYTNPVTYPASYPGVLPVAATDTNDARASFSSYNDYNRVSAPGVAILSSAPTSGTEISDPSGYVYLSGTSMATPHVAGLAALIIAIHPDYTWSQVKGIIEQSTDDLGTRGWDQYYGWGRINAYRAVTAAPPLTGIKGRIEDPAYNAISGATVSAGGLQTTTGTNGDYQLLLPQGTYDVYISHPSFGSLPTARSIAVANYQLTPVNLKLPSRTNTAANNDFEAGNLGSWNLGGAYTPIITNTVKHSGNYAAFVGLPNLSTGYDIPPGYSIISQTIQVPAAGWGSQPTFSFNYKVATTDSPGWDSFKVFIKSPSGNTLAAVLQTDQCTGWRHISSDLSAWAGQTIVIEFSVYNDPSLTTGIYLDEVSVGPLFDNLTPRLYLPIAGRNYTR